jgi:4-amino-4-deoxy-L-arabinose transferase-like glycosyltransferase
MTEAATLTPTDRAQSRWRTVLRHANTPLLALAALDFIVHAASGNNYGYFRDELYYLQDGLHPAFGYVDQAPLIGWLAWLTNLLFHDALFGIHLISAAVGAAIVFVTGLLARELGGGRFAQILAALAAMMTLVFLATASIFSMDVIDELCWTVAALVLVRLIKRNEPRLWLLFGLVAGIGLLNKYTMLFFGFGIVAGFMLTPHRAMFRTRWPWLGGLIAFAFLLPDLIWNAQHGWPTTTFWTHYGGLSGGGPIGFLANQLFSVNPFNLPVIIAGLIFYFRNPAGKPYRALGWAFVVLYVLFTIINAKAYFLTPIYPMLYAAGALQLEEVAQHARRRWVMPAYVAALALSGIALAPLAMPILPPAAFVHSYSALTNLGNGGAGQQNAGPFPQYLGDRFGWHAMTREVAAVVDKLPQAQRQQMCIFTENYGEASALLLLGGPYHLPPVISGHNNFYFWGPGSCTGATLLVVGIDPQGGQAFTAMLQPYFAQIMPEGAISCTYCMGTENGTLLYLVSQPKVPFAQLWPMLKHFD